MCIQSWGSISPPPPCRCWKPSVVMGPPTTTTTLQLTLPKPTYTTLECKGRHCQHQPECYGTTMRLMNEYHNR